MEQRYEKMSEYGMRSVEEDPQKLPLILCIVDEVSDLMIQDKGRKLETLLVKLAQKGRAAGIFMVLATQRPSVNVISGLIKANFPGRIACKTATKTDSMVILDRPGAEGLLGRGDAVLQNMKFPSVRFQAAYTTPTLNIDLFNKIKRAMV
jgi:S-DNA-T family DNA segregation ATPase FtsK/SpoIIIE